MTCKEKALSEDYIEIITDFLVTEELTAGLNIDLCTISAGQGVYISYVNRATAPLLRGNAIYFTPQCYGLMSETDSEKMAEKAAVPQNIAGQEIKAAQIGRINDLSARLIDFDTFALTDTGILQTQRPPLSLTGRGVVMGFLDTGERVKLLSGQQKNRSTKSKSAKAERFTLSEQKSKIENRLQTDARYDAPLPYDLTEEYR